jgi:tetratricopeptide (TPR) repeat protein
VRAPLSNLHALGFYRPLRTLSYRLDYAIGGLDPRVFHASNLVYHALTVLLVHAILARVGASPVAAFVGALIFAVHPVQTDAVTYAAGRRDILCGLFFAAGFLAFLHYRATRSRRALAAAAIAYLLAILAKEMAVTLPLVCFVYELFSRSRAGTGDVSTRDSLARATVLQQKGPYRLFVGLAIAGAVVAWAAYGRFVGRVIEVTPWHGGSIATNLATVARVWAHYLALVVWPAQLSVDYSYRAFPVSTTAFDPRALGAALLVAALAVVASWLWRRGSLAGFGAAWWAVTLLPVSHVIPYRELLAEHYLYLPMVGVACVVAGAIDAVRVGSAARRVALAAMLLIALAAAWRSVVRNRDWRDAETLWAATVATVPECARARFNLGQAYFERVRFDAAEREWLAAVAITPDDLDTLVALAMLSYRQGRFEDAERWVAAALSRRPDDVRVLNLAGWIALAGGDPARARPRFDAALARVATADVRGGRLARERAAAADGARLGHEQAAAALARAGARP